MYQNRVRKNNPGFLVILIDQCEAMGEPMLNGNGTMAENTANAINKILNELILCYTVSDDWCDEYIFFRSIRIIVVGYGCHNTCIICDHWIDELDSFYPLEKCETAEIEGALYETELLKIVEPFAKGSFSMDCALSLAEEEVVTWQKWYSSSDDVVPLIINVTSGSIVREKSNIVGSIAKDIMDQQIPDGCPILFNIRLSQNNSRQLVEFPNGLSQCNDTCSEILFESSSVITEDLKNRCSTFFSKKMCHEGSKLFVDNITNQQDLFEVLLFVIEYFRRPWNKIPTIL